MKLSIKIIFSVIFSFLFSGICTAQTAEEHFKRGDKLLVRKLVPDAIVEFKNIIS